MKNLFFELFDRHGPTFNAPADFMQIIKTWDLLNNLHPFQERVGGGGGRLLRRSNGQFFDQSECSKLRILNRKLSANLLYSFIAVEILK